MDSRQYNKLIVLLDGASVSGKSTIKNRLLADPRPDFHYIRRYTTRAQRPDDAANPDYIFTSEVDFRQRELAGELLEWRHFLFGMSYGLGWPEIRQGIASGKNVLAVMNLGNVRNVNALQQGKDEHGSARAPVLDMKDDRARLTAEEKAVFIRCLHKLSSGSHEYRQLTSRHHLKQTN
ncbi:MAG: hypothetical protein F9K29_05955 [Hyphomicrobiaceae bacterium]|nr:MAG: hypothetical protein F9K29_05955 [Hyphomicrobiaceae bacterium]